MIVADMIKYREPLIDWHNSITEYYEGNETLEQLEKLMLTSYSLSKLIRDNELNGISNPKLTGNVQEINTIINRAMIVMEHREVDPLVKANVLEILSRSAYSILRQSRY